MMEPVQAVVYHFREIAVVFLIGNLLEILQSFGRRGALYVDFFRDLHLI